MALPYATEDQLKILERKTKADLDRKTANINLTANTLDDMNALIASGAVNDGQLCYLKEDKKLYVLKEGVWSEVGGGGGIPVVEVTSISGDGYTIGKAQTANFILNISNLYYINMDYIGGSYLGGGVSVIDSGSDTFLQIYTFFGQGTTIAKSEKVLALSYLFNDYAIFTEGMQSEEILPYDTSADEGKVLTIRNGDLVWATPTGGSGSISVTFED